METKKLTIPSFFIISLFLISLTSPISINNPNLPLVTRQETTSSGSNDWNDLINVPAGFADNIDDTALGGTDGNNYTTAISFSGGATKTLTLSRSGLSDLTATFNDNDADTDTFQTNYSDYLNTKNYTTNGTFYLATNPSSYTTNASCSAFINSTGIVKDYSTFGYITNATMNKTISCSSITGGSDADFCVDDASAGGGNPFNQVLNTTSNVSFQNVTVNKLYIDTSINLSNNVSIFTIDTPQIYETKRGYIFVIDDEPYPGGFGEGYFGIYNNPEGNTIVYGASNQGGTGSNDPLDPSTDSIAVAHAFTDDFSASKFTPSYDFHSQAPYPSIVLRFLTYTGNMYFGTSEANPLRNIMFNSTNVTFVGDVNMSKTITSPTLGISNCDVKAHSNNGTLYCGTDATGSGGSSVPVGNPIIMRQSADLGVTSMTTWSDTGLLFNLVSGQTYRLLCDMMFTGAAATTGQAINLTTNATTSNVNVVYETWSSATAPVGFSATTFNTALTGTGSGAGVIKKNTITSDFVTSSSGSIWIRIRSEVDSSTSTLIRGSSCELFNMTDIISTPISNATGRFPATARQSVDIRSGVITTFNVTQMGFILETAKTYRLNCNVLFNATAVTTGMTLNLTTTATTSNVNVVYETWSSATALVGFSATTFNTALTGTGSGAGVTKVNKITADFTTSSAGAINVTTRSEVANGNMIVKTGSECELWDMT